ncbi:MAG: hypothetical protein AB7E72_05900 [Lysobacterales bacterium]
MSDPNSGSQPNRNALVPSKIDLAPGTSIDIAWMPEKDRQVLLGEYTKGLLDIAKKAQELHVDSAALRKTLDDLAGTTREVAETGNAVTISHTQTTSVGRTEVIMGNTQQAQSGRLSKSQTGEKDYTPWYVFGGILAFVIIVALMGK